MHHDRADNRLGVQKQDAPGHVLIGCGAGHVVQVILDPQLAAHAGLIGRVDPGG